MPITGGSHPPALRPGFAYIAPMPCSHLPPADASDPLRVDDTHLTVTVLLLARGIAADLGFDRLPILADALEDAGCDNPKLLKHLRHEKRHVTECWALRRLLRTTLTLPGGVPITFAYCPPGTFMMETDHTNTRLDERPVRQVTLTRGFYAGIYPITQRQWSALMEQWPVEFTPENVALEHRGEQRPIEWVNWEEAKQFCRRASKSLGLNVRLPTEAEWEYACRAGTTTEFHYGDVPNPELMNYDSDQTWNGSVRTASRDQTTDVGIFPPNPWGLFDCHGNVWEWCQDYYFSATDDTTPIVDPLNTVPNSVNDVVCRGGAYCSGPAECRSGNSEDAMDGEQHAAGFRVVFTAT